MEKLSEILKEQEIFLEDDQLKKLIAYKRLLLVGNEKINLTAITEEEQIYVKHFLDSLLVFKTKGIKPGDRVIDIGTGAGLPGIPMKIQDPSLKMTLLDSLNKRILFLKEVLHTLDLKDVEAIHGRAEELGRSPSYREQYDVAISRAVAPLNTLCEYALPFVKPGGVFISMKGPQGKEELQESERAIQILSARIEGVHTFIIGEEENTRNVILIRKTGKTDGKYPRGGGKPKKNPL